MAATPVRIQLCGRICVEIGGQRREARLPGPQGRRLFAYLTLRRMDALTRADLHATRWGDRPPAAAEAALGALLSRLRQAVAPIGIDGLRLLLPACAWVDLEAARDAIHRAESALALGGMGPCLGCGPDHAVHRAPRIPGWRGPALDRRDPAGA